MFRILSLTAIFIVVFIASFVVARGLALEQARQGQAKIGSVSTMPDLRGAVE
jgi:hypothetical protein